MTAPSLNREYARHAAEAVAILFEGMAHHREKFGEIVPSRARLRYNSTGRGYKRRRVAVLEWLARQVAENKSAAISCQQPQSVV